MAADIERARGPWRGYGVELKAENERVRVAAERLAASLEVLIDSYEGVAYDRCIHDEEFAEAARPIEEAKRALAEFRAGGGRGDG